MRICQMNVPKKKVVNKSEGLMMIKPLKTKPFGSSLVTKDYKFIDEFCETYGISQGKGKVYLLILFLDRYKKTIRARR